MSNNYKWFTIKITCPDDSPLDEQGMEATVQAIQEMLEHDADFTDYPPLSVEIISCEISPIVWEWFYEQKMASAYHE